MNWDYSLGIVSGCLLTGIGSYLVFHWQQKAERRKDQQIVLSVLEAIHGEISVLWELYYEDLGKKLEQGLDDEIFLWYYNPRQDYFSIYSKSTAVIASLPDNTLQNKIIKTYTLAKSLLDYYQVHNVTLKEYSKYQFLYDQNNDQTIKSYMDDREEELIRQVSALKEIHGKAKDAVDAMCSMLRKKINSMT